MAQPLKNDGHKDTFGAPKGGWVQFDKHGKRIKDEEEETHEEG